MNIRHLWAAVCLLLLLSACHMAAFDPGKVSEAEAAVDAYLQAHWPGEDFTAEVRLDPLRDDQDICFHVSSTASPDTWFTLYYRTEDGRILENHDREMERTASGLHTVERLEQEYEILAFTSMGDFPAPEGGACWGSCDVLADRAAFAQMWEAGGAYLDMPFSTGLSLDWRILLTVQVRAEATMDPEQTAEILSELYRRLKEAGCSFVTYDIYLCWEWGGYRNGQRQEFLYSCAPEDLEAPDLAERVDVWSETGV